MLHLKYQIRDRQDGDVVADRTFYESSQIPRFFRQLDPPHEVTPIDIWAPLAGDADHMIHVTGTVSTWLVSPEDVEELGRHIRDQNVIDQIKQDVEKFGQPRYEWVVFAHGKRYTREPKQNAPKTSNGS